MLLIFLHDRLLGALQCLLIPSHSFSGRVRYNVDTTISEYKEHYHEIAKFMNEIRYTSGSDLPFALGSYLYAIHIFQARGKSWVERRGEEIRPDGTAIKSLWKPPTAPIKKENQKSFITAQNKIKLSLSVSRCENEVGMNHVTKQMDAWFASFTWGEEFVNICSV